MAFYGTTTSLSAYLALTGRTLTGDATQALYAGTTYIDGTYADRFRSTPSTDENEWPRVAYGVTVPVLVQNATFEAAYIWGSDNASLSVSASGSSVVKREKVDGAVEVEYAENKDTGLNAIEASTPIFSVIEGLLNRYLSKSRTSVGVAFVV